MAEPDPDDAAIAEFHAAARRRNVRIFTVAGHEFNVSSPKQLGDVLFDELGLKIAGKATKKTATGQRSTKESELEKLRDAHPIISDILEHRQLQKLLGTYVDSIPKLLDKEGRLHTSYIQTGAATGRMASKDPNLQNIPIRSDRGRAIRHAFIAPKGSVLLGIRAVVAQSFERIHRSNLVGMGVMPLVFEEGTSWQSLGLKGDEQVTIRGLHGELKPHQRLIAEIVSGNGTLKRVPLICRIDTLDELDYFKNGGILQYVLRQLAG